MNRALRRNSDGKLEPADGIPDAPNVGDEVTLDGKRWRVDYITSPNDCPFINGTHWGHEVKFAPSSRGMACPPSAPSGKGDSEGNNGCPVRLGDAMFSKGDL